MLVVARKQGQSILIGRSKEAIAAGEFVEVSITSVRGSQVKLGLEATGDVKFYRDDMFADWCEAHDVIPAFEPSKPLFDTSAA